MSRLPDLEMWRASAEHFGVLNNQPIPTPKQMELFSSVYRADLEAVEGYKAPDPHPVLDAPITAFIAEDDMLDIGQAAALKGWTSRSFEAIKVEGGHFHPLERPEQLERLLIERL
jgi:surfactin synthase thioesterase subunit